MLFYTLIIYKLLKLKAKRNPLNLTPSYYKLKTKHFSLGIKKPETKLGFFGKN
ncbi:hypothetical protein P20652_0053 [Pseudoalteromonas sp. BSi20652]|nr:hypothetical protein P20652_0053 [Pseudoalteromonas sp. BSi20652]